MHNIPNKVNVYLLFAYHIFEVCLTEEKNSKFDEDVVQFFYIGPMRVIAGDGCKNKAVREKKCSMALEIEEFIYPECVIYRN